MLCFSSVDCNRRAPEPKYKNDENVLGNVVTEFRQIGNRKEKICHRPRDLFVVRRSIFFFTFELWFDEVPMLFSM